MTMNNDNEQQTMMVNNGDEEWQPKWHLKGVIWASVCFFSIKYI